ncbi:gliding motility-associated ABC transporter substrate-binding protein GldG [Mucilaginibacter sabulilitoris]|uniref:Gliding motility-associated ABC transporter substrate-binding protein GldG n=1 Tax=Mucilaginibacter sabulilitoris TaxID=1173583 RepID=A0ABZ0TWI2_9SPHI|nr:gliding motility-associated ABC transporter substrate-binding protein GldG [Mucilaginibacter sabulilitoris]WPU95485.1 gliding motility-associated ABC transporter substrate-binding protein GldG [Mucilaginibacter sabulilitoris]
MAQEYCNFGAQHLIKAVLSILKKEINSYLSSLVAYVVIGVFLLVLGLFLWVFPDSSILDYGYAGLESLFSTAPYLFMFLIPAITMRSLAEERKEGTFELLFTRPLTDWQIVLGKYFASVLLVLFALLPTLFYYFSVSTLGTPQGNIDTGAVIGSYIGLFLLGMAFTAIGLFASSVTKNQIIAFTIAVFLCFFFYSGFDSLSQLLSLQDLGLQNLGITEHYESVSRGVLDTRDLAYFIIVTGLFIGLTLFVISSQRKRKLFTATMLGYIGGLVFIALLSGIAFTRFDFTSEKRYTISPISRQIMDGLNEPVKVTVYLQGNGFPGDLKHLQNATKDMLADLKSYSHARLQFEFVDLLASLKNLSPALQKQTYEDMAFKGILGEEKSWKTEDGVSQKLIFPEALVKSGDKEIVVNLIQTRIGLSYTEQLNNSIQNLEYAFSSAIKKATTGGKPQIGFTEGHNELTDLQLNDAMKSLADGYEVGRVNLNSIPFDSLQKIKLLVIPKPDKKFTELEKFKLDQYIMRGGRVIWTIDQVNAELDSLRGHGGEQLAFPKQLNLDDQLFRYGIRINYDLIADMNCSQIPVSTGSMGGQAQIQMLPWLFYPVFIPMSKHPVVKNLDGISSEFVSTIDLLETKNIKKTVLLTSSPYNNKITAPHILSLQALEQEPNPKDFQSTPKTVGALLEGKFISNWRNRPLPEGLTEQVTIQPESKPTKMIVISDGDVFKNQVATDGSPYPLGYDHYTRQTFGNKNLLLNIADYMTDDSGLIALRTKEIKMRLLSRARIRNEKMYWQLVNTAGPLILVLICAIFQHYIRKRKYAH